jgi:hypothetical protein
LKRRPKSSSTTPWWLAPTAVRDEKPWDPDSYDDLDAEERAARQLRFDDWRRMREAAIVRAKRVLKDSSSTPEEKHEARILIGTYAIDPQLMLASGFGPADHGNQGMATPSNPHPHTPLPPTHRATLSGRLRSGLRRVGKRLRR